MNPEFAHIKAVIQCRFFSNCKYTEYHLAHSEFLDDDGYPTDEALEIIKRWHWDNKKGLFSFIKGIWWMPSFGWHEEEDDEETTYNISTAGWSGNESIIHALEQNQSFVWGTTWVQSRRGGHYIFEVKHDDSAV